MRPLAVAMHDLPLEPALAWMTVFLVFVGEIRLPIGDSELYLPLALFPAAVLALLRFGRRRLFVPYGALALVVVLACGMLGEIASDGLSVRRSLAAMFPVAGAALVLCSLAGVRELAPIARSAMLCGGSVLALWVILLSAQVVTSGLPFYEAKLLIETPLGRSNYLSAFLLVCAATAWGRAPATALLALAGIVASLSRGGLLITAVFFGLMFLARWRLAVATALILITGALAATAYLATVDLNLQHSVSQEGIVEGLTSLASATNRIVLWQTSHGLIKASPWLGIGPNGFRSVIERTPGMEDVWGPHSAVLLLWLNYGLCGLLAYVLYLSRLWAAHHRAAKTLAVRSPDPVGCVLLALALFAMFEPLVGSASFEVLLAILYAAALGPYPSLDSTDSVKISR